LRRCGSGASALHRLVAIASKPAIIRRVKRPLGRPIHSIEAVFQEALGLRIYLNIVQIIISAALIALTVMQSKAEGLGGMFGSDSSIYHTRRGV